jgi:cytochrome c-type biogenesis protein CcmE
VTSTEPINVSPVEPPESSSRSNRRSWIVVSVLVLAVGALLVQGLLSNLNYFETVDQAFSHRASLGTNDFRLEGLVTKGTIVRTNQGADFTIQGSHNRSVLVHEIGQPPQLFQSNIPVVVDGHFTSAQSVTFVAHQVIVKHTSYYVERHPRRVKAPNGSVR